MNRNKYRGKSIDEEYKTGEWIYGSLVFDQMGNPFIVGPVVEACEEYINFEYWTPVDPETVGVHTGLQGRNGVDIYEGDITSEGQVFSYSTQRGCWYLDKNGNEIQWNAHALTHGGTRLPYFVIGNIHDNPYLIGAVKP